MTDRAFLGSRSAASQSGTFASSQSSASATCLKPAAIFPMVRHAGRGEGREEGRRPVAVHHEPGTFPLDLRWSVCCDTPMVGLLQTGLVAPRMAAGGSVRQGRKTKFLSVRLV